MSDASVDSFHQWHLLYFTAYSIVFCKAWNVSSSQFTCETSSYDDDDCLVLLLLNAPLCAIRIKVYAQHTLTHYEAGNVLNSEGNNKKYTLNEGCNEDMRRRLHKIIIQMLCNVHFVPFHSTCFIRLISYALEIYYYF